MRLAIFDSFESRRNTNFGAKLTKYQVSDNRTKGRTSCWMWSTLVLREEDPLFLSQSYSTIRRLNYNKPTLSGHLGINIKIHLVQNDLQHIRWSKASRSGPVPPALLFESKTWVCPLNRMMHCTITEIDANILWTITISRNACPCFFRLYFLLILNTGLKIW